MLIVAALLATPAMAEDRLRDLCSERPGLDTPACTVDAGHLQIELGLGDWTLDRQPDSREDRIVAGDILARYGIGETTEIRLGWNGLGHVRTRDRATGAIDHITGAGDVTIGLKQNLASPSGDGFSIALLPEANLPAGREGIGAGDWGASLRIPTSYDVTDKITLELTPEIDAAVDADGSGRHTAYGSAAGVGFKLSKIVSMSAEVQVIRDRDPSGHSSQVLGGLFLAYQPSDRSQVDLGAQAGLNHTTPDVELYFGVTRKF